MAEQRKQAGLWIGVVGSVIVLAAVVAVVAHKRKEAGPTHTEHSQHEHYSPGAAANQTDNPTKPAISREPVLSTEPATSTEPPILTEPATPKGADTAPVAARKLTLREVIQSARSWEPIYESWYGKRAPDFTLTDIAGKQHKLSDYRGRDVMLVFWATWCRPCIVEVPHLIALQNVLGKDKLAVLAISYVSPINTAEMVKGFVEQNERINYAVFSASQSDMLAPYNAIQGIPSSFFIEPGGKIKLATSGLLSLGYMKAILQAERQ
ncbi:MAG: peroxiredoxin family protein [Planctomycetota bacterium]|jgi:peroxiredoxin